MIQIGVGFQPTNAPLHGNQISAQGLHGVLFHVLQQADARGATWLHKHPAPKPYTLTPYYDTEAEALAGIRLTAVSDSAAQILSAAWQTARREQWPLRIGPLPFTVRDVVVIPGETFETLIAAPPEPRVGLRFLSPTAFRQGPGHLPLPLPRNVFGGPWRVWNRYAPTTLSLPTDWLDWCDAVVFVVSHAIQTAAVAISPHKPSFVGFVGDVYFEARSDALLYLSTLQALAQLAPYCGVGHKTTMGMGAVELLSSGSI
jgi:CRISPR-associated endoribonuclease Cas6